jgi:hypothetical protein
MYVMEPVPPNANDSLGRLIAGRGEYVDDIKPENVLFLKIVRSTS